MLLAIDVGNTNIKLGVYDGDALLQSWRLSVSTPRTADELGINMQNLLSAKGLDAGDIDGVIMSSVQPLLNYTVAHACAYYLGHKPLTVGVGVKTGLNIKYYNPQEIGADRIVNSVAAYRLYGGPCIVVDFGTATTFNAIGAGGEFLGGCIAPGIKTGMDSLVKHTAKLPRVELLKPEGVVGRSTAENMQAGIIYGFTGLVRHIVALMKRESGMENAKVLATGGLSSLILEADDAHTIDVVDRFLTLKGLKLIYDMNRRDKPSAAEKA